MHAVSLLNKNAVILVVCALAINAIFLYAYNPRVYFAITQAHGQIGYNLYQYAMIGMNQECTDYVCNEMRKQGRLIEYRDLHQLFGEPHQAFPINDTVGYGILLGILWKITHSLLFYDVQLLQIIIFAMCMIFYYQIAYMLFASESIAFLCSIMQLCFFPLIAYNVMPVRDVWAYYGLLLLCYTVLASFTKQLPILQRLIYLVFFSCCLWMRPTLACAVIMMSLCIGGYAFKHTDIRRRALFLMVHIWLVTVLLFWIPFMYFNYKQYNRLVVSPAGQSLLEGLGEIPNQWGHKLSDEYVNEFISAKYNLTYGTIAFDDAAMTEFKLCVKENPWHYIKTLIYRLPDILLPGLQWIFYEHSPYADCGNMIYKLLYACSSFGRFINFVMRHIYMRIYLIGGYIGMLCMFRRKKYGALACIITCLLSGLSTYPSHIEYRYIVPFYWVFSLAVGYAWYCVRSSRVAYRAFDAHTI